MRRWFPGEALLAILVKEYQGPENLESAAHEAREEDKLRLGVDWAPVGVGGALAWLSAEFLSTDIDNPDRRENVPII